MDFFFFLESRINHLSVCNEIHQCLSEFSKDFGHLQSNCQFEDYPWVWVDKSVHEFPFFVVAVLDSVRQTWVSAPLRGGFAGPPLLFDWQSLIHTVIHCWDTIHNILEIFDHKGILGSIWHHFYQMYLHLLFPGHFLFVLLGLVLFLPPFLCFIVIHLVEQAECLDYCNFCLVVGPFCAYKCGHIVVKQTWGVVECVFELLQLAGRCM